MICTELGNAHPAFGGSMDTAGGRSIFWTVWCTGVVESDFFSCLGGFICKYTQSIIHKFTSIHKKNIPYHIPHNLVRILKT